MKRKVLSVALLLFGAQVWTEGCRAAMPLPPGPGYGYESGYERPPRDRAGYVKDAWTVWFRGRAVEDASAQSFVDLGSGYGRDHWKVFFEGREIREASAQSFAVLAGGYARDNWKVFWAGHPVPDAVAGSFAVLGDGYARDNWAVFWCGRKVPGADPPPLK